MYLHLNPDQVMPLPSFGRDARKIGHWGTGDLELSISHADEFELANPLIRMAYEGRGIALESPRVEQDLKRDLAHD